jgi:hypothetical protein
MVQEKPQVSKTARPGAPGSLPDLVYDNSIFLRKSWVLDSWSRKTPGLEDRETWGFQGQEERWRLYPRASSLTRERQLNFSSEELGF